MKIYIDGDGCAVKDETYKVAERYKLHVIVVANKWMNVPINPLIEMKVVDHAFDVFVNARGREVRNSARSRQQRREGALRGRRRRKRHDGVGAWTYPFTCDASAIVRGSLDAMGAQGRGALFAAHRPERAETAFARSVTHRRAGETGSEHHDVDALHGAEPSSNRGGARCLARPS